MRWRRRRSRLQAEINAKVDEIQARWQHDLERIARYDADEQLTDEEKLAVTQAILLAPTRYARLSPSGMRTDAACPPHLRAIRKPSGGYW